MMKHDDSDNSLDSSLGYPDLYTYWGIHEYDVDHHQVLMNREKNRFYFHYNSPQLSYRGTLVDWMQKVAALKKIDNNSIHLAVYILDVFMDSHSIVPERLHLVALVCLLLATKFEERDKKCLKSSDLNKLIGNKYPLIQFLRLEKIMLQHLRWNLFFPTAVQFVNHYISYLITEDDIIECNNNTGDLWHVGKKTVRIYLDCVLSDVELMQKRPSIVAASIIALTRLELGLVTVWPAQLISLTGFRLYDLKTIVAILRQIIKSQKTN